MHTFIYYLGGVKAEETIDYHIRYAWNLIAKHYNNTASQYGATMASGYTLLYIDKNEGTPSTKLGPAMGMEPRSIVRTLSLLEERKLIYRERSQDDGRVVLIKLTEEGLKKRALAKQSVIDLNEFLFKHIEQEKLDTFFEVIQQITASLKQQLNPTKNTNQHETQY